MAVFLLIINFFPMSANPWIDVINKVEPYIFKISAPYDGSGSGFQISLTNELCGLATAYHVIAHAYEWDEPIKITHYKSGKSLLLPKDRRTIIPIPDKDLALIIFHKDTLPLETIDPILVPPNKILRQGWEIGWCGFPSIAENQMCFFEGYVSCCQEADLSYLVDGVAINGVSGGPVFHISDKGEPVFCGVITAYRPNKSYGETLPGLSYIRIIEPYQNILKTFKSLNQAKKKATEIIKEEEQKNTTKMESGKAQEEKK